MQYFSGEMGRAAAATTTILCSNRFFMPFFVLLSTTSRPTDHPGQQSAKLSVYLSHNNTQNYSFSLACMLLACLLAVVAGTFPVSNNVNIYFHLNVGSL